MPTYIPIEIIAIEADGFHLMLQVKLNGRDARMLIDTGASRSVFDKERIALLFSGGVPEMEENMQKSTGLGTSDMPSEAFYLETFCIGELVIRHYPAVVLDMSHVNSSYDMLGLPPIDGVLGSDILQKYGARIDYRSRILRLNLRGVKTI